MITLPPNVLALSLSYLFRRMYHLFCNSVILSLCVWLVLPRSQLSSSLLPRCDRSHCRHDHNLPTPCVCSRGSSDEHDSHTSLVSPRNVPTVPLCLSMSSCLITLSMSYHTLLSPLLLAWDVECNGLSRHDHTCRDDHTTTSIAYHSYLCGLNYFTSC